MKKGQTSSFMQTAKYFQVKYKDEWIEVQAKYKIIDENKPSPDALVGQTVTIYP